METVVTSQCDQMLELKVAQFFVNLPKKLTHQSFSLKIDLFQNHPKRCRIFGLLL